MLRAEVCPTSYTFSSLIKACGMLFALKLGESLHCQAWKTGFDANAFLLTALVDFYGKLGRISESRKMFDEMPERDSFAWGTIISVHARAGDMSSAGQLFYEMPEKNATAWNNMIDGYSRLGDVGSAALLFNQMPMKDLVSWTTMITCYSQSKRYKDALAVFDEMMKNGIWPDEITLATIISCCAHLGALNVGKGIHCYIFQERLSLDVYIGSALVDMYAKCGQLDRSLIVFLNLEEKNVYSWNTIIEGLGAHGHGKSALAMFRNMLKGNIKPNGVTFISILSACSHAGLVAEGREVFQTMINDFQIDPQIEHYGCMADLFCKAKLLEDAQKLIKSMKIEPNAVIWGALLSGCKLCKNLEMAEIAVSKLIELEPGNCGYYSLLVTMYAEANRWKEVGKIRTTMRELGVEKRCPGASWIERENELHQFIAADKSHPASSELHILLDDLHGQLKLADYLPKQSEIQCAGSYNNNAKSQGGRVIGGGNGDILCLLLVLDITIEGRICLQWIKGDILVKVTKRFSLEWSIAVSSMSCNLQSLF
ncbi:hypothetical protein Cgig2_014284 [Carnegiea gigantea]|uniref:Pentatricopeptide repeat-containing protein n=1 Tax=Carnegiea gigantea TaxID=171969 RepID=A0A9Q1JMJ4_9CARY|nr:hypothetical protein Cgig2_014284 [Carnegiea gigantea]